MPVDSPFMYLMLRVKEIRTQVLELLYAICTGLPPQEESAQTHMIVPRNVFSSIVT